MGTLTLLNTYDHNKAMASCYNKKGEIVEGEEALTMINKNYDDKALSIINKDNDSRAMASHSYKEEMNEEEGVTGKEADELHLPLPLHVAMKIFAQLPIPCIAQLRLVCKSWNSLLSSSSFLSNLELEYKTVCDKGCCTEWWFVMAAAAAVPTTTATTTTPFLHDFLAFSYPLWKPFRLPIHTSPKLGDLLLRVASSQSLVPSVVNMLVASAGGLMCAVVKGTPLGLTGGGPLPNTSPSLISELTYDMVVFNCLTGELKTLPRPGRLANKLISSCLISMKAEAGTNTYGIILCDTKYREMEIYDSRTGNWRRGIGIRASVERDVLTSGGGGGDVLMRDLLESDVMRYHKEELAVYDAGGDRWRRVDVALPRVAGTELLRSTVVKCQGGVYMVACLMKKAERMEGYGVWKLMEQRGGGLRWAERGRTPAQMVAGFGRTKFESPACYDCRFVGAGEKSEWVCMTGVHYTIGSRTRAEYWPPLLYNVNLRQWHLLPPRHCLCIFPFEPRFTALV